MLLLEDVSEEKQLQIMEKIAEKIIQFGLTVPALFFLEMHKPLSFVGSSLLIVLSPFAKVILNYDDFQLFALMLEKRENVEKLMEVIERKDIEHREQLKRVKTQKKSLKKISKNKGGNL